MKFTKATIKDILKEKYSGKIMMLLKFTSSEDFAEDVLNGNLYMNTAQFYREYEEKCNTKGIGDINELKLEMLPETLTLNINGTEIKLKPTGRAVFEYDNDKEMPIYCMTYLTIDDFDVIEYDENNVVLGININIDMLRKDFGEYVSIINADEFKERVFIKQEEYDVDAVFGFVKYREKYDEKRTEEFLSGSIERFLYKDKSYEHQKECRLIIGEYVSDDKYFRIGDIRDIAQNCKTSELRDTLLIKIENVNIEVENMTLLDKLEDAVNNGLVKEPFETKDIKDWIKACGITNDDENGNDYEASYIESFASSSVRGSSSTKSDKKLRIVNNKQPRTYKFV